MTHHPRRDLTGLEETSLQGIAAAITTGNIQPHVSYTGTAGETFGLIIRPGTKVPERELASVQAADATKQQ